MGSLTTSAAVIRSTLAAAVGRPEALFPGTGRLYRASLHFGDHARFPGGTELMARGRRYEILVRLASEDGAVGTACVRFPDLYGVGRDQDFLFASSADGAPLHHVALPVRTVGPRLYSSLWLYLAGISPVLFGLRAHAQSAAADSDPGIGDELTFLISPPVGSFREIGVITLAEEITDSSGVRFAAHNCGGNLRALPPLRFYHDTAVPAAAK
jgi:hypothetical protein